MFLVFRFNLLFGTCNFIDALADNEETSEVPMPHVPLKVLQSSTVFFQDTHSYIDGTKDWKTMKKRPEVPDVSCSTQSSTIIYCFLSGTHSYIDGTKDWKTMKKRLRFQMPHVPLKVLRGKQDQEDVHGQIL